MDIDKVFSALWLEYSDVLRKRDEAAASGQRRRVFDWAKAVAILKETGAKNAVAGLSGDMGATSGEILRDGKIVHGDDTYTYLASSWAEPVIVVDGMREIPCWSYSDESDYDEYTYWPEESVSEYLKG